MTNEEKVEQGNLVKINYVGKYDSGEVFDKSKDKPLEFIAGEKMVVKGFDDAIIGMKKGEKKSFELKPGEAYGEAKKELVQEVPKKAFGEKASQLKEGMTIGLNHPQQPGRMMPAVVKNVGDEKVKLDLNHPLAGKTLHFDIEVVDFREATDEDREKFKPKGPQQQAAAQKKQKKDDKKKE